MHVRIFFATTLAFASVLAVITPRSALAGPLIERMQLFAPDALQAGVGELSLATYIGRIIAVLLSLIGTIFFAQMIYAGYLWMTARGEKEPMEKAKNIIRRSIIGIVIVLAAWALSVFIVSAITDAAGYSPTSGGG